MIEMIRKQCQHKSFTAPSYRFQIVYEINILMRNPFCKMIIFHSSLLIIPNLYIILSLSLNLDCNSLIQTLRPNVYSCSIRQLPNPSSIWICFGFPFVSFVEVFFSGTLSITTFGIIQRLPALCAPGIRFWLQRMFTRRWESPISLLFQRLINISFSALSPSQC